LGGDKMSGIGRNMPCPCMSGKKFKKCCEISGIWSVLKEQGVNYYHETFALKHLWESDQIFRAFYSNERAKINKDVFFVQTDNMRSAASFGSFEDLAYLIISKHSQFPLDSSIHVAHEFEHLVLCSQGFKITSYIDEHFNQISRKHKMINDMIYDPKLNKILIGYGYDLKSYLNLSDKIQIGTIGNNEEDIFLAMTLYVKRFFDYKNLNPDITTKEIYYNKWLASNHPTLVEPAEEIIRIVETNGVETPKETEKTINLIINEVGLQGKLIQKYL
jgi:hypothetical protein